MKKILLFSSFVALSVWLLRYQIVYQYDIYRMEQAFDEDEIARYNAKIQELSDKIGTAAFVKTYIDTTEPNRVRRAAALALMKSDKSFVETVFGRQINSANPDVSGMAIRDLGLMKSNKYRNEIVRKRNNSNEIVRWSVVDYLGHFNDPESVGALKAIRSGDESEMVRNSATVKLKQLLKPPAMQQAGKD